LHHTSECRAAHAAAPGRSGALAANAEHGPHGLGFTTRRFAIEKIQDNFLPKCDDQGHMLVWRRRSLMNVIAGHNFMCEGDY